MSLTFAFLVYGGIVAFVSSILTYYFKVLRPKEEEELLKKTQIHLTNNS